MRRTLLLVALFGCLAVFWAAVLGTRDEPLGAAFAGRERLSEGAQPGLRVVPANAGAADLLALLLPPERVAALPSPVAEYGSPTLTRGEWALRPRYASYTAEDVLAFSPDLVVAHAWQSADTAERLREAGVQVLVLELPRSWSDIVAAIERIAAVVGRATEAAHLRDQLAQRRVRLGQRARAFAGARALSYSNLGAGGWAAGSGTTADILFELAGLENAARSLEGHQPIDLETLLRLDPDWIVVGTTSGEPGAAPTASYLLAEQTLAGLRAIRERRVVELDPHLFSTSSTELLAAAEALCSALEVAARPR
jgi:iron complex transport system substrate-binding protein